MNLIIVFGLPGAGKTFVGKLLEKEFEFFVYEADNAMPQELQQAIREQQVVSDTQRDSFFENIIAQVNKLQTEHDKIVVTQVFIKEKYRKKFLEAFPQAKFILVEASDSIREERLMNQKKWQLDLEYWRKMADLFEEPEIKHIKIYNIHAGEEELKQKLQLLIT